MTWVLAAAVLVVGGVAAVLAALRQWHARPAGPPAAPWEADVPAPDVQPASVDLAGVARPAGAAGHATFTPDQATATQRRAIDTVLELVNPALERDSSDDLVHHIPRIVQTCRSLVRDDPRSIRFVEELHDTASCAALEEAATRGTPGGAPGWGRLTAHLERAFPGVGSVRNGD